MPIAAPPDGNRAHPLAAATALYRQTHDEIRAALDGLSDDVAHWAPAAGTNSIAVLVVHLLASEAEALRTIGNLPVSRDRASEFDDTPRTVAELLHLVDAADSLLTEVSRHAPDLGRVVALPTLPAEETRPAMTWLIANYGHAREHLGQLLLTKQLALNTPREGL